MGILERLFGKRSSEVESQHDKSPAALDRPPGTPPADSGSGADQAAETAEAVEENGATAPEHPSKESPPLSALTRYQHDPAFNNFKRRLSRAPGIEDPTRGRNLDYPLPGETKR